MTTHLMTDAVVAHGYTMRDLDKLTAAACSYDRSMASDARTRYDVAWSAIAEALCAADEPPQWHDLFTIGWRAIYDEVRAMRHTYGFADKDGTRGVASSPRFVQYWTQPPVRPDEGLTERMAVGQILSVLTDTEREAVIALAVHDDYARAAQALGIADSALRQRLTTARRRFRGHWFAPETAPAIKGTDRRAASHTKALATHCRGGNGPHEMTPENTYRRPSPKPGRRGERVCRACETERSKTRLQQQRTQDGAA